MTLQSRTFSLALVFAVGTPGAAIADETPSADPAPVTLTAVDLFMRDQAVVLKPKQVVLELNTLRSVTYTEAEPSTVSGRIPTEHSQLSVGLGVQVGITDGFSAYANLPLQRTSEATGYTGAGKRTGRTQLGSVTLGVQKTLVNESADSPMVSLNAHGQVATKHDGRNGLGFALNVSRSIDPAILFGSLSYDHLFAGESKATPARATSTDSVTGEDALAVNDKASAGASRSASARAINTIGVTGGVALAVNDKVSVSGSLSANYTPQGFVGRERYRAQLGLTYAVSKSAWVEASTGWGLNGPGSDAAFGITAGFQFQ